MVEITPEKPAPTPGEIMNALRIRDAVADIVSRTSGITRAEGRSAAERLLERGYIDVAKVHAAIVNDDDGDDLGDED